MPLSTGTRLGVFEVLGPLGKGGMGEVYRARDSRLGREVAIKVLPTEVARDPERLTRFEREARVLASLNHPNIATLHGFERDGEVGFLVMELVEGETLADRIGRGPIPWREAVTIFEAIADGLKAAHESGIVHRDLKPANVKIDDQGRVKILDFGLARSAAGDDAGVVRVLSHSPTLVAPTVEGVLLGTAGYMSPEQARGLRVDRRADVWAFGCCLYEALSGARAFDGEDIPLILVAIFSREPNWQQLPSELPRELTTLLRRCLEKDARQRMQDLGDARWWLAESRELASGRSEPLPVPSRRSRGWVAGIAAAALVVGTAAGWLFATRAGVPRSSVGGSAATVAHFEVAPPETSTVATPLGRAVAVHPGGASFVFDAGDSLHRYELAEGASYAIAGTAGGAQAFFSDDGEWLGLFGGGGLAKMRPGGGPTEELCATSGLPAGASWHGDRIVFGVWDGPDRGLWWIRSSGGTRERLGDDPALAVGTHPSFLEGGRAIVFAAPGDEGDLATQELRVFDLSTGVVHDLGVKGRAPQYLSSGHLLWVQDEAVWAAAFDVDHSRLVGGPRQVLGLESTSLPVAAFAVSPNGTLVTVNHERFDLVEIAPDGSRRRLAAAEGQLGQPRLSRDGRFVAYMRGGVGLEKIWIHEVATGRESRLSDAGAQKYPVWTSNGDLVYESILSSRYRLRVATPFGGGEPSTLFERDQEIFPYTVSPAGVLLFSAGEAGSGKDFRTNSLWRLDLASKQSAKVWSTETSHQAAFSPDGRWVAYLALAAAQIYVRPFPGPGGARPVGGGSAPAWSADGRTLYLESASGLSAVDVRRIGEDLLELGAARVITELRSDPWERGYDPKPNGRGFIAVERRDEPSNYTVVVNLGQQLRGRDQGARPEPL